MKLRTILSLSTILTVANAQAQAQSQQIGQCERKGGTCVNRTTITGVCKTFDCSGNTCCRNYRITRQANKCKECQAQGGKCLQKKKASRCTTTTIDSLCKGNSCTCCLGDSKQCGSSSQCTQKGGICIKKNKKNQYCSSGTFRPSLCSGNSCGCCIFNQAKTTCKCGQVNTRIVGGVQVSPQNKYPWMVALWASGGFACGGALINDLYVLTAGHCLYDPFSNNALKASQMKVGVADHNIYSANEDVAGVTRLIEVDKLIVHPKYSISDFPDDIALMRLKERIDLSANKQVKPICLPKDDSNTYEGYDATVAGWGLEDFNDASQPSTLREVTVPIWDTKCTGYSSSLITGKMLCAGKKKGGKDSCSGDSGGGLWVQEKNVNTIVGIVSFGDGCALPRRPGVYTRVSKYLQWITANTKDGNYCS